MSALGWGLCLSGSRDAGEGVGLLEVVVSVLAFLFWGVSVMVVVVVVVDEVVVSVEDEEEDDAAVLFAG